MNNNMENKTPNKLVELKNVTKTVKQGKQSKDILKDVSFSINEGDWIGVVGGNGAGKTTLVEIISGINKQTSGEIEYLYPYVKDFREEIGIQFQSSDFPFALSVKDMIKLATSSRKLKLTKEELEHILVIFDVKDIYHRRANSLSGGQKQKVNILMSIIHKPKLLILDEFSTGLDVAIRKQILSILESLKNNIKISGMVVSHHLSEIETLCNKIAVMRGGVVSEIVEVSSIVKKYGSVEKFVLNHVIEEGEKYEFNF